MVSEYDNRRPPQRRPGSIPTNASSAVRKPAAKGTGKRRGGWPMAERSALPTVLGIPPIAAVGLGAALTAVGVLVDLTRIGGLGTVFTICYIAGCVLAVVWVRRNGLFGPMVQPPLLVAVAVPVVALLVGTPRPGQGVANQLLLVGAPLVNVFPIMAWATGAVLVIGFVRMLLQRLPDHPQPAGEAGATRGYDVNGRRNGRDAARGAGRTSRSPRRS